MSDDKLVVNGWGLVKLEGADERRILDVELGERLGYAKPLRDIQKVIEGLVKDGELPGVLCEERTLLTSMPRGGSKSDIVKAYYLTEREALQVITKSRTKIAYKITKEIIDVYLVVKNSLSHDRIRALEGNVIELLRRVVDQPNGLLGSNATDLIGRMKEVVAKRKMLGDPNATLTAVDNETRMLVGYPRVRGAAWKYCPAHVGTRAHSYVAAQIDTLDKRISKSHKATRASRQLNLVRS